MTEITKATESKELQELKQDRDTILQTAHSLQVTNQSESEISVSVMQRLKGMIKKIKDHHAPMKKSAHETWKEIVAAENSMLEPITDAMTQVKNTNGAYLIAEQEKADAAERVAEAARRKAEREAREKEDREKAALQKKIDAAKKPETVASLEIQQEEVYVEPEPVEAPVVAPLVKTKGNAVTYEYAVEVTNLKVLLTAVINGEVALDVNSFLKVSTGKLKTYVNNSPNKSLPGCRVTRSVKQSVRG